jgi:hypothetical protein
MGKLESAAGTKTRGERLNWMGWFGRLNIRGDGKSETINCEMESVAGIFMEKRIDKKLIGKGLWY